MVSVAYDDHATTSPLSAPADAAASPITKSDRPCTEGLFSTPTDSVSSVDPATMVPDQPIPSSVRPIESRRRVVPGRAGDRTRGTSSAIPPRMTGRRRPGR